MPFCSRVFAEKTRFSPHNARVQTDQISQIPSPSTLEEAGRIGSELNPGGTYRCVSIVAVAVAEIVRDGKPKDSQEQISSADGLGFPSHVECNKRSNSGGVSPVASALANFQAVRGLTDFPRRVDLRVGYEIPARLARSVKLHPRRAHAALSCSGTIATTNPPVPTRNGLWPSLRAPPGGTSCGAGSPRAPPRRPADEGRCRV